MLKYLPKGKTAISELVDSRTKDSDLAIVFNQNLGELIKTVYETCQNMVKIAQDQNGNILIDEYAMDDVTPSSDMKEKMFTKVGTEIMEQLHRFCKDDYSGLFKIEYKDNTKVLIDGPDVTETDFVATDKYSYTEDRTPIVGGNKVVTTEIVAGKAAAEGVSAVKTKKTVNTYYEYNNKDSYLPIDNVKNYETSLLSTIDSSIRDMFIYGVLNAWFTAVNSDVLKAMATSEYTKAKDIFLRSLKPLYRKYKFNKVNSYA